MRLLSRARLAARGVLGGLLWAGAAHGQAPPRVELRPSDASFDEEFTQVHAVRELSDGRLIVADQREKRLVLLDPRTGSVRAISRVGSGPGEYQWLHMLVALPADTTLIVDGENQRWLILAGERVVQTISADQALPNALGTELTGADTSGHVTATHLDREIRMRHLREGQAGVWPDRIDSLVLLRAHRRSGRVDTIGSLRSRSWRMKVSQRPGRVAVLSLNPLESSEQALLFADGWIALARQQPYRVDWRRPDGSVQRGTPVPAATIRVDDREKQYALTRRYGGGTRPPTITADDVPPWPENLPPFLDHALFAAPDGRVVVARTQGAAVPEPRYDVIDRRGVVNGQLVLRPNERLAGFGARAVYIVERDVDDIERIRRHPWP